MACKDVNFDGMHVTTLKLPCFYLEHEWCLLPTNQIQAIYSHILIHSLEWNQKTPRCNAMLSFNCYFALDKDCGIIGPNQKN